MLQKEQRPFLREEGGAVSFESVEDLVDGSVFNSVSIFVVVCAVFEVLVGGDIAVVEEDSETGGTGIQVCRQRPEDVRGHPLCDSPGRSLC